LDLLLPIFGKKMNLKRTNEFYKHNKIQV
jgi:hypothetical protein